MTSTNFIMFFLYSLLAAQVFHANSFDVRHHLSTTTRYPSGMEVSNEVSSHHVVPPAGCVPIHLNLVSRHGTRSPTVKRIKAMDELAKRLENLVSTSGDVPKWLKGWQSPWRGKKGAGELLIQGEEELFQLGIRVREKYPDIFKEDYHPDFYLISATQVPRASASAVAFGMGLFSGKGNLGPGMQRAFAVITDTRSKDIHLRFHESCQKYKDVKKAQKPALDNLLSGPLSGIANTVADRFKLNFTIDDISSLWFLCKQQAALLDITDQACGLFTAEEVKLLEWIDDTEFHFLKGYGKSINYRMGIPLLKSVLQSMEEAIQASEGHEVSNPWEKARLRFAHAETVIPFTCLLGLFLNNEDFKKMQREEALEPPPPPPKERLWRGALVAPYAANTMLTLHKCPVEGKQAGKDTSKFLVQVFHNEQPITLPACNDSYFCPFEDFKDYVVAPHMGVSFDSLCSATLDTSAKPKCSEESKSSSIYKIFQWFRSESCDDKSEL